ncbi:MAG: hypothetical protein HGA78_08800, partial [Nitrospirales bacterium]|nr:hypothetical protein [Nitrospirales bacterium]
MKKCILLLMTIACIPFLFSSASADFDERLWEMYAEIIVSGDARPPSFGGIYIDRLTRSGGKAQAPFADIRVVTGKKEEVPYGIKTLSPETGTEELPVTVRNISVTKARESYCEGVLQE